MTNPDVTAAGVNLQRNFLRRRADCGIDEVEEVTLGIVKGGLYGAAALSQSPVCRG
jgi:hypothetical protein